jgi:hypothetical protein
MRSGSLIAQTIASSASKERLRYQNGAAAVGVVGQPDFTTTAAATTDRGLDGALGHPFVDGSGSLWISENDNDRVVRFPADETAPLLVVTTVTVEETITRSLLAASTAATHASAMTFTLWLKLARRSRIVVSEALEMFGSDSLSKPVALKAQFPPGLDPFTIVRNSRSS